MADEAVNKQMEDTKARAEETRKQGQDRLSKGKPTPTQEENDRASLGEHVLEKEDDGSGPDPHDQLQKRDAEAGRPAGYQTRQAQAQPSATRQPPPRPAPPKSE